MIKIRPLGFVLILGLALNGCAKQAHRKPPAAGAKTEPQNPYYYVVRSNLEAYEGKYGDSLQNLLKALESYPKDATLLYLAAERFAEANQWEEALKYAKATLKAKPKWTLAKILMGRVYEAQSEYGNAEHLFRQAIHEAPGQEDGYFRLAQVLVDRKKWAPAIAVLKQWIAKHPDSMVAWYYIATIQSSYMENPSAAFESYKKIVALDPENVRIRYQLAQLYLKEEKLKEALEQFAEIEQRLPGDLGVKLNIASILHDLGRTEEAVAKLQNILKVNPQADRIHYFLGLIYEQAKQFEAALFSFEHVVPASGLYKEAVLHQALIYRDAKKYKETIAVLERSLRRLARESQVWQFLALAWEESEKLDKAAAVLQQGLKKIPNDEQIYFNLGVLHDKREDREASIEAMRQVIRINPNNAQALNFVGYLYAEEGKNLEEAYALIQRALKLKPGDGYIIDSLGWIFYQKGDYKKAHFYIQKAMRQTPAEPTIVEHLGDVFLKQGRKKEALQQFRRALELGRKKEKPDAQEIQRVEKKIGALTA